jgi:hypothetical protein
MRKVTTINQVYTFDELSEKAQEYAYSKHEPYDEHIFDAAHATLKAFCDALGLELKNYRYGGGYSDCIDVAFEQSNRGQELSGLRLRTWLLNNYGAVLYAPHYLRHIKVGKDTQHKMMGKRRTKTDGTFYAPFYSNLKQTSDCVLTGICYDHDILAPIYAFIEKPCAGTNLDDLVNRCLHEFMRAVRVEVEHVSSFEYFKTDCVDCEVEFLLNGERFYE